MSSTNPDGKTTAATFTGRRLAAAAVPALVAVVAAAVWGVAIWHVATASFGGDLRGLLHLADVRPHPTAMAGIPRTATKGYDGQYYAALATDPFLQCSETVASLDNPPYRSLRFGLPLTAWLAALGQPAAAIVAYQILCWLGAAGAVFLLARWLAASGGGSWWALAAALGAGTFTSVVRCTPDAAATALVLAALVAHRRERFGCTLLLSAAAVVVRETSWLAAAAVAVAELSRRRPRRALTAALVPLFPLAAWMLWTHRTVGGLPLSGQGNFAVPFTWAAKKAVQLGEQLSPNPVEVVGVTAIVAMLLSPLALLRRRALEDSAAVTYLFFGGLAWSLGWAVWSDAHAFSRVLLPLAFLAPALAAGQRDRGRRTLLVAVPVTLLAVASVMAWTTWRSGAPTAVGEPATATDVPTGGGETFFVLGVARTRGQSGMWRTDIELSNPLPASVTVTVEVLPADPAKRPFRPTLVRLRPREVRLEERVLETLVPFYGVVGMRLSTDRPGVTIRWTTHLESETPDRARWNLALPLSGAFREGRPARLAGLAQDPATGTRSDLALLNVSDRPLDLRIDIGGGGARPAVHRESLAPWQFLMLPGILDAAGPVAGPQSAATVSTLTPGGAFLVRATVVRPDGEPVQVEAAPAS